MASHTREVCTDELYNDQSADRTDAEVTDEMDNFFDIVEARVNRAFKVRKQTVRTRVDTVADQEYYGLPNDYSGMRSINVVDPTDESERNTLKFRTPEQITDMADDNITGDVQNYYTIVADQIQVMPAQAAALKIEMVYYQKLLPLTAVNLTNWVGDNHPDAYINGLVTEISKFVKDKESAALWTAEFKTSLAEIAKEDVDERWAGTPMEIKVS